MKRIVLITEELSNSTPYERTLLQLFGQEIQVRSFSVRKHDYPSMPKDADLYLISCTSSDAYKEVSAYLPADKPTVPAKITYLKRDIEALQQLPAGTRAILVNFSMQMAIESIAELHRLGITQIQLFPYCPGMAVPPRIEMAITPGEPQCVPPEFTSVLNLGSRVFSAETILEIGLHLGFSWLPASEHFRTYIQDLADPGRSLAALWNASLQTETYLDMLMGALKMGIIGVDVQGRIFAANATASGITGGVDIGGEIGTLLPDLGDAGSSYKQVRLMKIQDVFVNVSVVPVDWQGTRIGSFLLLQRFTEEEKRQHKFRAQLQDWGYRAKYTMDDIIGESEAIRQVKALAEKMAQTDSAILLTGESGTGKELFGHAIHNASRRREMPFVAINCAALTETLLESELFGYEEGAFTGAKKGGRPGLFELAHRGTLFLDEVEGMSPALQIKLLRTLQEREVMRVGGNRIIHVDVRIVAATNEALERKVRDGTFRRDLYYRLNTLPVVIPPLTERGDDMFLLMDQFRRELNGDFRLTEPVQDFFRRHTWPGNIRELRNVVEYFIYTDHRDITMEDLPPTLLLSGDALSRPASAPTVRQDAPVPSMSDSFRFVLAHLYAASEAGTPMGRDKLLQKAREAHVPLSQQEVRTILTEMAEQGLARVSRGRGGSQLTPKGRELWKIGQR